MTDTLESLLRDILIELRVQTKMLEQMQPSEQEEDEPAPRFETL